MNLENRDVSKQEDDGVGSAIEESIREENSRQSKDMRHRYLKDQQETEDAAEDEDGSTEIEESGQPEKQKSHKHKSHKHKKGGFHVYVEARDCQSFKLSFWTHTTEIKHLVVPLVHVGAAGYTSVKSPSCLGFPHDRLSGGWRTS